MLLHGGIAEQLIERLQHGLRVAVFVAGNVENQHTQQAAGDAAVMHLGNIVRKERENGALHELQYTAPVALGEQLLELSGVAFQRAAEAARHKPCHLPNSAL